MAHYRYIEIFDRIRRFCDAYLFESSYFIFSLFNVIGRIWYFMIFDLGGVQFEIRSGL